jgi:hypothetical protein
VKYTNRRNSPAVFLLVKQIVNQKHLHIAGWFLLASTSLLTVKTTADEFSDIKLLRAVPFNEVELKAAYGAARSDTCEQVGEGQPLEMSSFTPFLTNRDQQKTSRRLPAATRRGFLSIGLEIDQTGLPTLSKSKILDYVDKNYVTIQARIRKDLLDRELYYHHRPIALTCQYNGTKLSRAFEPVVAQTVSNIRSLGVFAEPDKRPLKAEHLRTIVLAFRFERVGRFAGKAMEDFELAIIRGKKTKDGLNLQSHVFVTQDNRSRLVYLRPFDYPKLEQGCSIIGKVQITEFDSSTGLYPKKSVTQNYRLAKRAEFERISLEDYCKRTYDGTMSTHINQLLDDIIDNKVTKAESNLPEPKF